MQILKEWWHLVRPARLSERTHGAVQASVEPSDPGLIALLPKGMTFAPERRWHALPGNRIELGTSGFAIQLHVGPTLYLYEAIGPEGQRLAAGGDLSSLKQVCERLARERLEFAPAHRSA